MLNSEDRLEIPSHPQDPRHPQGTLPRGFQMEDGGPLLSGIALSDTHIWPAIKTDTRSGKGSRT